MLWTATLCLVLWSGVPPPSAASCGDAGVERYEPRTFLGYACEDDCERHKAGFQWAEWHSVTDPRRCASLPRPEAEGCAAYADGDQDAETAGDRWAVENEVAGPCHCNGAGERFRAGCARALEIRANASR